MTQKELTLLNLGDSLDNISNIDPRGYGVCHILYPASREYTGGPLCMNAAGKLCDTLKQDDLVYIMTGFVLPPFGSAETDGVSAPSCSRVRSLSRSAQSPLLSARRRMSPPSRLWRQLSDFISMSL